MKMDADGYYAARILCDVLPPLAEFSHTDSLSVAKELEDAKASDSMLALRIN
jgi:hypothetical protein